MMKYYWVLFTQSVMQREEKKEVITDQHPLIFVEDLRKNFDYAIFTLINWKELTTE